MSQWIDLFWRASKPSHCYVRCHLCLFPITSLKYHFLQLNFQPLDFLFHGWSTWNTSCNYQLHCQTRKQDFYAFLPSDTTWEEKPPYLHIKKQLAQKDSWTQYSVLLKEAIPWTPPYKNQHQLPYLPALQSLSGCSGFKAWEWGWLKLGTIANRDRQQAMRSWIRPCHKWDHHNFLMQTPDQNHQIIHRWTGPSASSSGQVLLKLLFASNTSQLY